MAWFVGQDEVVHRLGLIAVQVQADADAVHALAFDGREFAVGDDEFEQADVEVELLLNGEVAVDALGELGQVGVVLGLDDVAVEVGHVMLGDIGGQEAVQVFFGDAHLGFLQAVQAGDACKELHQQVQDKLVHGRAAGG
ncbi:MAG: hypothetical protein DDT34_02488 [Firmicutes bacterium]|nr:hypothetical protein [Bacillota bacterium]